MLIFCHWRRMEPLPAMTVCVFRQETQPHCSHVVIHQHNKPLWQIQGGPEGLLSITLSEESHPPSSGCVLLVILSTTVITTEIT